MAQTARSGNGASRVERKLEQSLTEGNYYEAHQMYRTLYSRYSAQNKHVEVQKLMRKGAYLLFSQNESGSAVDLSLLLLDSLETSKAPVTEELIVTIGDLHKKIGNSHPQQENFEAKAIMWTALTDGVPKTGHSKLRGIFAQNLWREKAYDGARQHFLYSNDGASSAEMLVEFAISDGKEEEYDLFIAQFVLQLLCIRSKQTANVAFITYTEKHPKCESMPPFSLPMLNFIFFLLAAVESQKLATFTALCDKYKPSIARDPDYFQYLERIGENFFGLQLPKRKKPKGLLGNLFQGLMGEEGGESETFMDMPGSNASKPSTSQLKMTEEDLD